jgi:hypothetical protein
MHLRLLAILAALTSASPAGANLRAPSARVFGPSTSLVSPLPDVVVEGETLQFSCTASRCVVVAIYRISSPVEVDFATEFIMPAPSPLTYRVNSAAGRSIPAPIPEEEVPDNLQLTLGWARAGKVELYKAPITGTLEAGANRIELHYEQPLGSYEASYGYFKESRYLHSFGYELWPLRQWQLGPDFALEVRVSMTSPEGGWWERTFGPKEGLRCGGPLSGASPAQRGGEHLVWKRTYGAAFPERLVCMFGDEDLLER